jgi:hypothetical protein
MASPGDALLMLDGASVHAFPAQWQAAGLPPMRQP